MVVLPIDSCEWHCLFCWVWNTGYLALNPHRLPTVDHSGDLWWSVGALLAPRFWRGRLSRGFVFPIYPPWLVRTPSPDISWITCCDHLRILDFRFQIGGCLVQNDYVSQTLMEVQSWPPPLSESALCNLKSAIRNRQSGGTPIYVVSRQQFMKYPD